MLGIRDAQFVERHVARARIVDVRRNGGRLGLRAQCAGNEARPAGRAELVARGARQPGRLDVQFVRDSRQLVVPLGNRSRAEGVGFDDVGAGGKILLMNFEYDFRTRQGKQLVIALEILRMHAKARSAKIGLAQLVALDHGSHRAIQDQDALAQETCELCSARVCGEGIGKAWIGHGQGTGKDSEMGNGLKTQARQGSRRHVANLESYQKDRRATVPAELVLSVHTRGAAHKAAPPHRES